MPGTLAKWVLSMSVKKKPVSRPYASPTQELDELVPTPRCALTKIPEPVKAQIKPRANRFDSVCRKKQKAASGTHRLESVARKVALPRLVLTRAKCQNTRSPAKQAPAISNSRHCGRLGRAVGLF